MRSTLTGRGDQCDSSFLSSSWVRSALPLTSYQPAGSDSGEQPFRMIRIFHLKRGQERAFTEALNDVNEVDRRAGITVPRRVLRLKFGHGR